MKYLIVALPNNKGACKLGVGNEADSLPLLSVVVCKCLIRFLNDS